MVVRKRLQMPDYASASYLRPCGTRFHGLRSSEISHLYRPRSQCQSYVALIFDSLGWENWMHLNFTLNWQHLGKATHLNLQTQAGDVSKTLGAASLCGERVNRGLLNREKTGAFGCKYLGHILLRNCQIRQGAAWSYEDFKRTAVRWWKKLWLSETAQLCNLDFWAWPPLPPPNTFPYRNSQDPSAKHLLLASLEQKHV